MLAARSNWPAQSALERNRNGYESLLARAERYAARGRHDLAAAWAEIAADHAWNSHPGCFADHRLERLLAEIGAAKVPTFRARGSYASDAPRSVLHVLTEAYAIGGHTRFTWRWIEIDRQRRHCVVLTRHRLPGGPPEQLKSAAQASGGWVRALDCRRELPVPRARHLRALAAEHDLIVVHAHPFDVLPAIAFANSGSAPVVVLNHAGFAFWAGRDVADVVACLRPSSRQLALTRRGLTAERCPPLPIPVDEPAETVSRSQARAALGLPEDACILFTVADPFKYVSFEPGCAFTDVATTIAQADERVLVLAIGPEDEGDWRQARERTNGRVRALGRHPEVDLHERAADLYLDPFPVTSPTAFLEAGRCGLPIVSFCPHRDRAPVLCADDFTADALLARAQSAASFVAQVTRLIEDSAARHELGRATAEAIVEGHGPRAFATRLAEVYARAAAMHARGRTRASDAAPPGPLDECLVRLQEAAGISFSFPDLAGRHLESLPHGAREWLQLRARVSRYLSGRRATTTASPPMSTDLVRSQPP